MTITQSLAAGGAVEAPRRPIGKGNGKGIMFALGALTPLGVISTITVWDVPISLMWLAALVAVGTGSLRLRRAHLIYLVLGSALCVKCLIGGAVGTAAKFLVGVLFLVCLAPLRHADGLAYFRGLNWMIPISLIYAAYQSAVFLIFDDAAGYGSTLPVALWNSKGWHAVLTDNMNLPRASAFMFEPAYFAMILDISLAGELIYRRSRARPKIIVRNLLGLVLANSRVGLIATLVILLTAWLAKRNSRNALQWMAVAAAIGPLLPLFFIFEQLVDFTNNRELIDISVFSRYVSFLAFLQQDLLSMLFGVLDYHDAFVTNPLLSNFSDILEGQGANLDPKSFLASNLFHFGIIGSVLFYGGQMAVFRRSARTLALLASINLIFFNVYAYSWPLYWVMIALTIVVWKGDTDAILGMSHQARAR